MDFEIRLDPAMQRRLVRRQLLGRWSSLVVISGFTWFALTHDASKGKIGTLEIVCLTLLGLVILTGVTSYVIQCRTIREWHRLQGDAPVSYQVDDDVIRATSNLGAIEFKWTIFKELAVTREAYLLRYGRGGYLTLPIRDVPPDAFSLILGKFQSLRLPIRGA